MSDLLNEIQDGICCLTLNRIHKHNAFDDVLLVELQQQLDNAIRHPKVKVIVFKSNGSHFSAGADVAWMQRMADYSEEDNTKDALILGNVMHSVYQSPKPTIAMVQGSAFGGGAGLVAACDIAIAAESARFCFSEVKLGLIPAVISPYVIQAIGARVAKMLFMSAERFDAQRARSYNLVQYCVPAETLWEFTLQYAQQIGANAPQAVQQAKHLVHEVANKAIDKTLVHYTASLIAKRRISLEGQKGLRAFLNKETPDWN